jgi:N-acetylneuraminic acid mutarotase
VTAAFTVAAMVLFTFMVVAPPGAASAAPAATGAHQPAAKAKYSTPAGCNKAQKPGPSGKLYAQCFAMVASAVENSIMANPDTPPAGALGPTQIQDAYQLPPTGQGQTVAVVDAFGDTSAEADLDVFRAQYGLPPCTTANGCFKKVDQNGGTNYPANDSGWGLETSLDLDAVSSACPACNIMLVEADDDTIGNLGIAANEAVALGAKYVSNSYGLSGEASGETTLDQDYTHPGVAVTASTGDTGNVTNWPATNPNVVAVGGTTLIQDSSSARGWDETAWSEGGSGCSKYESQPAYQTGITTDCANRAIADISADADPDTGLAVYDTLGENGWLQVGGTSLSSPLVAAMYALAGTPVTGTFPVTYPYQAQAGSLNDVTQGTDGACGNVLCTAGPGWDGPTGLGTPHGVAALSTGPHGDIAGTVTSQASGAPIAGATVSTPEGFGARTDASGHYDMNVPVGTYDVTASAFGFESQTTSGVTVSEGTSTTVNDSLAIAPTHTLSGNVTDGSGHGWPLYAKITIDGYPGGPVYTNPFTGHYSVTLPAGFTANLQVNPVAGGYTTADAQVQIGDTDTVQNVPVTIDTASCTAPGYKFQGIAENFTGWTGTTTQDGWTQVDNLGNGEVWRFDNPGNESPPGGGDLDFAIEDSFHYGSGHSQDASLVSPVADLSTATDPTISFVTYYFEFPGDNSQTGDVDLSLDGGTTWTTVWHQTTAIIGPDGVNQISIPIPQAAGDANVRIRFHYTGANESGNWGVDNVQVGTHACELVPGGLVAGRVTDNNTGKPVNEAKVSVDSTGDSGTSVATPADPALGGGYYSLFTTASGSQSLTASQGRYTSVHATTAVVNDAVTRQDFALQAGHLTVTPGSVTATETLGASTTSTVQFTNNGTEPVTVTLGEQNGVFTPTASGNGAPLSLIKGHFSTGRAAGGSAGTARPSQSPDASPWADIANYPMPVMDNAVAYNDGKVYSVDGFNGNVNVANGYVYDPAAGSWSPIADAPAPLENPAAAFAGGKLYLIGGWNDAGGIDAETFVYDPVSNTWSNGPRMPVALAAPAVTVLNGDIYVVGGCTGTSNCAPTSNEVYRYDPSANSWTRLADYPTPVAFGACAGIAGEVVCAGGNDADTDTSLTATYLYDPDTNTWSQGADMPVDAWGALASGANDRLQVTGGAINNSAVVTNQAFEYNPVTDSWAALPNANNAEYRGGGSCGMYQIGGSTGGFTPVPSADVLPGYDECGTSGVPWLSAGTTQFSVAPGASATVPVTMDSSVVPQPGAYTAKLLVSSNSPYSYAPIGATMTVNPPASWGEITGTVTDAGTGSPLAGAIVQIDTLGGTGAVTYTLNTDASGHYQLWLDTRDDPLQVIVADDGYKPQAMSVKIKRGSSTTANFALLKV